MEDRLTALLDEALGGDEQALGKLMVELEELGFPEIGEGVGERYRLLKMQVEGLKRQHKACAEAFLSAETKRLFDTRPSLQSFSWRQYAPSWSEGDTGRYWAYIDELMVNGEEVTERGWPPKTTVGKLRGDILSMLRRVGNDLLIEVYGPSRTVTISREGVNTEWYWAEDDW